MKERILNFLRDLRDYLDWEIILEVIVPIIGIIMLGILAIFGFSLLFAFPLKWLWNWLMPDIFGLIKVTVWQAWGILILSSLLFGRGGNYSSKKSKKPSSNYN
jgi:hypothetical protein